MKNLTDDQLNTLLVAHGKGDDGFHEFARACIVADRVLNKHESRTDALQDIASYIGVGGFNGASDELLTGRIKAEFLRLSKLTTPFTSEGGEIADDCGQCAECLKGKIEDGIPALASRMIVCANCGNKRCPKASNHREACTQSNEPGQAGSRYTK